MPKIQNATKTPYQACRRCDKSKVHDSRCARKLRRAHATHSEPGNMSIGIKQVGPHQREETGAIGRQANALDDANVAGQR